MNTDSDSDQTNNKSEYCFFPDPRISALIRGQNLLGRKSRTFGIRPIAQRFHIVSGKF
jgi:hypothetical protein